MMRRLRSESGWALVTGMMMMALMMSIGLATYSFTDSQTRQSASSRDQEASFGYGEGVLSSEAFLLSSKWPSTSATAMPDCASSNGTTVTATGGSGGISSCPAPVELAQSFNGRDYTGPLSWTARVRDNPGTEKCVVTGKLLCSYYYDDTALAAAARWDQNGDGQLWVRGQAVFRNDRRSMVTRVQLDKQTVDVPQAAIVAGRITMSGSPHATIQTKYAPVYVRCSTSTTGCVTAKRPTKQFDPYTVEGNYAVAQALTDPVLEQLRQRAKAEGGWYATCPTNPTTSLVFVESGNCGAGALPTTSASSRGTFVLVNGTLSFAGNSDYYGLLYLANRQNSTGDVFSIKGKHKIVGSIIVDGPGGVNIGTSSKSALIYDPSALEGLYFYNGSTVVRPSFREIKTTTP
jgi:hypothetical protein